MPNPMPQVLILCDKWFLKNHNFRQKFHILLILTGKNALRLLQWRVFRVQAMPNPTALVASLYDKRLMKSHNFRRHIVENGIQTMKIGWDICSSPPWVPFYSYTMFQNPISWPSHKKCRKNIITLKGLVTQSSNIVHCNWHTQKLICADLQAFANMFSPCKLMFFAVFGQGEFWKTAKISHFCWFWQGKCIKMAWVMHI